MSQTRRHLPKCPFTSHCGQAKTLRETLRQAFLRRIGASQNGNGRGTLEMLPRNRISSLLRLETLEVRQMLSVTYIEQDHVFAFDEVDPDTGAFLGESVAVDGDTMVVGARLEELPGKTSAGAVYVYSRNDNGTPADTSDDFWLEQAKLTASDAMAFDEFGFSVSISGETVVVGSRFDDAAGSVSGSAYIFTRGAGGWSQQAKLIPSDAVAGDFLGTSVAISGETVVVGSIGDDDAGSESGSAYIFTRSGSSWSEQAKLTANDAAADDRFGN